MPDWNEDWGKVQPGTKGKHTISHTHIPLPNSLKITDNSSLKNYLLIVVLIINHITLLFHRV